MFDPVLKRTLALVALCVAILPLGVWLWQANDTPNLLGNNKITGQALIGGAFTLVDHEGQLVSEADFKDKYTLVYFGYTFCPDVCPLELQTITDALELLGPIARNIIPVFITVDPERDTISVMADYAENFHPRLRALTGTQDQVRRVMRAYRVYSNKSTLDEDLKDYLMDHTSLVYFMGPDGAYITHFTFGTSAEIMATRLAKFLG